MNVNDYSDEELLEWLDLNQPTDRELEAKIIQLIKKHENNTEMKQFLMDVYAHFYEEEETDSLEGFQDGNNKIEDAENQGVILSKNIDYTKGLVNPLLKETITRIVSIDSQFRDDAVYKYSTNFSFNLSETLKNVVSLKLYSIQIPYTWYIISDNYGSNFFYIQGNVPGIDTMKYVISVNNGNTSVDKLIADVNNSIATLQANNPDVSFGVTKMNYNANDTRATFNLNIKNTFTTQYYSIKFPPPSNINNAKSIRELFGFNDNVYYPFRIFSTNFVLPISTTTPTSSFYIVDNTNNYFDIQLYTSVISTLPIFNGSSITVPQASSFDASNSIIQKTIRIQLSLNGQYNAKQILDEVNHQLQNNAYLENDIQQMHSIMSLEQVNSNEGYNLYRYYLQLRVNRAIGWNSLDENVKMAVIFPNITDAVWTGPTSCFKFQYSSNGIEMNNIVSENSIGTTNYIINKTPSINLVCTTQYYGDGSNIYGNNFKINVKNSGVNGYTLNDYYNAINTGINQFVSLDASFNGQFSGNIKNSPVIMSINNTNNYYAIMSFKILKVITSNNFYFDLSNSILRSWGFPQILDGGNSSPYKINKTYNSAGYRMNANNNTIYLKSHNDISNNYCQLPVNGIPVIISTVSTNFVSASEIVNQINIKLNQFNDNNLNLVDCNMLYSLNTAVGQEEISFSLNIQAILKENDYRVELQDNLSTTTDSSWKINFGFDSSYSLATSSSFTGSTLLSSNTITLDNSNNYFYVEPIYDSLGGVYDRLLSNMETVVLDLSINIQYTTEDIRNSINRVLNKPKSILYGSFLDTNNSQSSIWRWNINKSFRTEDYKMVLFDNTFVQCNYGENASVTNTTADTTLGWLLGYRSSLEYLFNPDNLEKYTSNLITNDSLNNIITIRSDTSISLNLYNYFLLVLDDYTQNHLNDGLVTTIYPDLDIPLPSYVNTKLMSCDPVTKQVVTTNTNNLGSSYNRLTNSQLYSVESIKSTIVQKNEKNTFSAGPYIQDIFGLIPIKTSGLSNGQTYVEFGGTLQLQERIYFGPVNIRRLSVKLMTDKGNVINLNGQNWSFSLVVTQLYSTKK